MTESAQGGPVPGRRRHPDGYDPVRTRRQLVDSALRLFERDGFDRTTLQEIVDDAELTKGAFYHHFESKEDLLWHIQNEYLERQLEVVRAALARHDGDVEQQIRAVIHLSLAGVAEYRAHVAIFYQERRHLSGERLADITAKRDELEALLRDVVQRGIDDGLIRSGLSARILTFGIIGMCAWAVQWFNPDGSLTIEEVADQFCTMVLHGVLT